MSRRIAKIFPPPTVPEGKGASVIRIIGTNQLPNLNSFMMLDNLNIKLPGGFPDQLHRGFETVTYLQQGSVFHEDNKGYTGHLKS